MKISKYAYLVLLLIPLIGWGQKQQSYASVTGELIEKIVGLPVSGEPTRVAVVPFTATKASESNSSAFGEYLTESIIGSLSGHPEKIKLFERTRLDAILKEHEFILTDLMKPAAALKIGQLAPIDAILSGTYTKLKTYIDVSARLIDVASGEISVSYGGRIKMTKNLATLFGENNEKSNDQAKPNDQVKTQANTPVTITINNNVSGSTPTKTKAELCRQKAEEFSSRLHDLTTEDKIEAVVGEASKTPFDNDCGQLHYMVMNAFTRYKIDNNHYKRFLLQSLDTIAFPAGDERALEIVRFMASDNLVDNDEWKSGFAALSRVGNYSLSSYITLLIAKGTTDENLIESRVQAYFQVAQSGNLGLPRPVTLEIAFIEMMEGVKANQPLREKVYETYASRLTLDDKSKPILFGGLQSMYKDEQQRDRKKIIIGWMADFINTHEYPKAHDQLYDFAFEFNLTLNERRNQEIQATHRPEDLQLLVSKAKDKFSGYAMQPEYESQKDDRIDFCVEHDIPIPGVIPTMEEAAGILKGTDFVQQLRVMELLALMGERPKSIEATLVDVLFKKSLENREQLAAVQVADLVVLGNIRSPNPKSIEYMISTLPHYGNDTEASEVALVKIGKPAVHQLVAKLDKTTEMDGGLQYQLISILGKIGKDAAEASKSIQKVLNASRNSDVRYAAEAALQVIGN